jgi:hypothetical protein
MSVRPSVSVSIRMGQLGYHWTDFKEILSLSVFRKSYSENQHFIKIGGE